MNEDNLYYGENVDFLQRKWVDYVQNIDTDIFGESKVYATLNGTGKIRINGKDFNFESGMILQFGMKEVLVFEGKLPPMISIQAIAPKNKKKLVIKRIRISPCLS